MLSKEEAKWQTRATWLESFLQKIYSTHSDLDNLREWFKTKIDQLVELDIQIKTGTKDKSSIIFDIGKYIKEQLQEQDDEGYPKDMLATSENTNYYPPIEIDGQPLSNDGTATFKARTMVREKLCLKVKKREETTDYFLTVYERKFFGNEKIFEKRIYTDGKEMTVNKLEFHPQGGYIFMEVMIRNQQLQLVFTQDDANKDPLMLKSNCTFLGFHEKNCYVMKNEKLVLEYDLKDFSKMRVVDLAAKSLPAPADEV